MAHAHTGHAHSHDHAHTVPDRTMGAALGLTLSFVALEALGGWHAHSLALLSDAGHNLADAAALGLTWYGIHAARKPAHHGMTFGYHRVGIFAALVNGIGLLVIAAFILWEAVQRLRYPEPASGAMMMGVAAGAVVVNLLIGLWLHAGARHNLNVRSAYLHMLGDAASAAGVVLAGALVVMTGTTLADPVISLLIAALIIYSSFGILRESATVLLEGTPLGVEMPAVIDVIKRVPGVLDVHDLHIWMVGPGIVACSCHIVVTDQPISDGQQVVRSVVQALEDGFQITHATVQVEAEGCTASDLYCMGASATTGA